MLAWAEAIGARRPIVHRLASVIDELLMNALREARRVPDATDHGAQRAVLRWASDECTLAISVSDGSGSLRQRDVVDHVRRARTERGRPNPAVSDAHGAGLGLYLVLANVASLIVNVDPGRQTEVVCLFDLARGERRAIAGGRPLVARVRAALSRAPVEPAGTGEVWASRPPGAGSAGAPTLLSVRRVCCNRDYRRYAEAR